jgi:hypothetical protein
MLSKMFTFSSVYNKMRLMKNSIVMHLHRKYFKIKFWSYFAKTLQSYKWIRYKQWWAQCSYSAFVLCKIEVLSTRFFKVLEHWASTEYWVITFKALKCLCKCAYIFKLILSICKAFKTISKFFKSNNSLTFDINLLTYE